MTNTARWTKARAKKDLLHFLSSVLTSDDEPWAGECCYEPESQEFRMKSAARDELVAEFERRSAL